MRVEVLKEIRKIGESLNVIKKVLITGLVERAKGRQENEGAQGAEKVEERSTKGQAKKEEEREKKEGTGEKEANRTKREKRAEQIGEEKIREEKMETRKEK